MWNPNIVSCALCGHLMHKYSAQMCNDEYICLLCLENADCQHLGDGCLFFLKETGNCWLSGVSCSHTTEKEEQR